MELHKIETLLESYFEGTTSLQEEQQLKTYFTSGKVAVHLEEYVVLFSAFAKAETQTYNAPIRVPRREFKVPVWIRIAAVIAICFGVFTQFNKPQQEVGGTYADMPEVAALKTKQALGIVSQMLTQSTAQLGVVKEFDNATSNFIKQ